jgi:hypothetical protein
MRYMMTGGSELVMPPGAALMQRQVDGGNLAAEQVLGHLKGSGSFLAALEENLVVDVQDAFGTHLFYALP